MQVQKTGKTMDGFDGRPYRIPRYRVLSTNLQLDDAWLLIGRPLDDATQVCFVNLHSLQNVHSLRVPTYHTPYRTGYSKYLTYL